MNDAEITEPTLSTLRTLGFRAEPVPRLLPGIQFSAEDCAVFDRYPRSVPWNEQNVPPADQALFKSIRGRLKQLARWLALNVRDEGFPAMREFASLYAPSGRSGQAIWSCIYPWWSPDKSYALQIALILSAGGAEVCLCLGAGRSALTEPRLAQAQDALRTLQSQLAVIPVDVADAVEGLLPRAAKLRRSWRQPGQSEFATVKEWAEYAGSPDGSQASISVYMSVADLEQLGVHIANVLDEMTVDAAPLFKYCYTSQLPEELALQSCDRCGHQGMAHQGPRTACLMKDCHAGPHGAGCPEFVDEGDDEPIVKAESADFTAGALHELAAAPPYGLELDPGVYQAVAAAIRSRKHIILTGPPGTAKTTLAEAICHLAADAGMCTEYMLTTATSDWTTYETIGGLHPAGSGTDLEFRPGILLDAIRANRWIIIDELNRSNFDRAFGQLFTVLSGQPVTLPYEDADTGDRIVLWPEDAARLHQAPGHTSILIPSSWRIVATMNVFDKSLLYEMSFALMRRFAFIEVPSPRDAVFVTLWERELADLSDQQAEIIKDVLRQLLAFRLVKDIGPAVFIDMAKFAREYLIEIADTSPGQLAFQLFYSYLLPQYEGITQQQGEDLYTKAIAIAGDPYKAQLTKTLAEVLGITLIAGKTADNIESDLAGR